MVIATCNPATGHVVRRHLPPALQALFFKDIKFDMQRDEIEEWIERATEGSEEKKAQFNEALINRRELLSKKGLIGPSIGTLLSVLGKRTKPDNADQTLEPETNMLELNKGF